MPRWTHEQYEAHLAKRAVSDTEQPELKKALVGDYEGEAQSTRFFFVRFTLYRCKLLDVDAKYGSVKDLLDCCHRAGLVDGDKEGQISLEVRQVKVQTRNEERTEIELS